MSMCYAEERRIEELEAANRDLLRTMYCLVEQQGGKATITTAQIVNIPLRGEIVTVPNLDGSLTVIAQTESPDEEDVQ